MYIYIHAHIYTQKNVFNRLPILAYRKVSFIWKTEEYILKEKHFQLKYEIINLPWPGADYAQGDDNVPAMGSRVAPRPPARWHRLRGWESWTRGWTTPSRSPPHCRGPLLFANISWSTDVPECARAISDRWYRSHHTSRHTFLDLVNRCF